MSCSSRIICESHAQDLFFLPKEAALFIHRVRENTYMCGLLSNRREKKSKKKWKASFSFLAYTPNKESWKPARDQSYSPKGLTARCPHNTFKASNSPPDQMQPGSAEKHWPLRLEPVLCSHVCSGFLSLEGCFRRKNEKKRRENPATQDATISYLRTAVSMGGGEAGFPHLVFLSLDS